MKLSQKKFCVYFTTYSGALLPSYYIGSTQTSKISDGYIGSVSSKKYRDLFQTERVNNPHLFSVDVLEQFDTRREATEREKELQIAYDVVNNPDFINQALATPNGFFGRDVSGKNNPRYGVKLSKEQKKKYADSICDLIKDPKRRAARREKQSASMNKICSNAKTIRDIAIADMVQTRKERGNYIQTETAKALCQRARAEKGFGFSYDISSATEKQLFSGCAYDLHAWCIYQGIPEFLTICNRAVDFKKTVVAVETGRQPHNKKPLDPAAFVGWTIYKYKKVK